MSNKQLNFARLAIACLDVIKLPLIDILDVYVKADELLRKIESNQSLMYGRYKLYRTEKEKCCIQPPDLPDYSQFDVTLLCKLISHLCPSLTPRKGWGFKPSDRDTGLGDDIVRIRMFRNEVFAHAATAEIDDKMFEEIWNEIERVLVRINSSTTDCKSVDYVAKLKEVKGMTTENKECTAVIPRLKDELKRMKEDITIAARGKLKKMRGGISKAIAVQTYERTPKESELEKASEYIGPSFPLLRAVLELQGTEIDQVKLDNQVSSRTQICKMLVSWKNRNPHHATIGQFIEAVKETCPEADIEDFEQCFFQDDGPTQ